MSNSTNQDAWIASMKQLVAGGAGGVCLVLAGHPMDTIKVRIQTMPTPKPGDPPMFTGTIDCVRRTLTNEGIRGFYRGMLAPLIGATPVNSICFFGYGLGVRLQTHGSPTQVDKLTYQQLFNAGMLSGFCTALVNAPVERIKCLLQIEQGSVKTAQYKGFWDCARKVYANGGIRSNYRGILVTFARDIPSSGMYFMGYEWLKKKGTATFNLQNQTAITLFAGGAAGMLYWAVAIPADVIKSKIQTAPEGKYSDGYRSIVQSMFAKQGLTGFYRGATPVFLRAFPANAACFFGYEYTMKLLDKLI